MTSQALRHAAADVPFDDTALARAAELREAVLREISRVYIGPTGTVELLLIALLARGHVLLEGVPGIAKTTLVKAFAATLGCTFRRIQFTPDLLPADITGTFVLDLESRRFELRRGPVFANVILGDEINRAPAKTQSALLEAMQEGQVTIDGQTERLDPPFMVLATQNPMDHEGVYLLPEAQLDRFMFRLTLGYPTETDERRLLRTYSAPVEPVRALIEGPTIMELADAAARVYVDDELIAYIVRLVSATRAHPRVRVGASPRASLLLMNSAKVHAMLRGRSYVIPDDVQAIAGYVLEHRVRLLPEAELDGPSPEAVVAQVVAEIVADTVYATLP